MSITDLGAKWYRWALILCVIKCAEDGTYVITKSAVEGRPGNRLMKKKGRGHGYTLQDPFQNILLYVACNWWSDSFLLPTYLPTQLMDRFGLDLGEVSLCVLV